jgi:hypothetical protein
MNADEEAATWDYILNSPLAIAALNQLAIEGFISPICKKTFYLNEKFGGLQTLLRVKCREPQGVSTAIGYDEMRVIFNRDRNEYRLSLTLNEFLLKVRQPSVYPNKRSSLCHQSPPAHFSILLKIN